MNLPIEEEIILTFEDMPYDGSEGHVAREILLDELLHGSEWYEDDSNCMNLIKQGF